MTSDVCTCITEAVRRYDGAVRKIKILESDPDMSCPIVWHNDLKTDVQGRAL